MSTSIGLPDDCISISPPLKLTSHDIIPSINQSINPGRGSPKPSFNICTNLPLIISKNQYFTVLRKDQDFLTGRGSLVAQEQGRLKQEKMLLFVHQRSKLSPWNRKLYLFSSHRDAKRRAAHGGGHGERRRGRDWGFVLDWGLGRREEERERERERERGHRWRRDGVVAVRPWQRARLHLTCTLYRLNSRIAAVRPLIYGWMDGMQECKMK
jgi:hypothetical protein